MVVSANGVVTRVSASSISRQGRPATGVKVQNLGENDYVVSVNKIVEPDEDDSVKKPRLKMRLKKLPRMFLQTNLNLE